MANEIQFIDPFGSGRTNYVTITDATGQWWNTVAAAFQAFNAANWADYDIAAVEFGTSSTYEADMPALAAGVYNFVARNRAGGSPVITDPRLASGTIHWAGSAVVPLATVLELMEADTVIVTSTTPWTLEYRRKGTATVLMTKQLKRLDGTNLTTDTVAVGRKVQ